MRLSVMQEQEHTLPSLLGFKSESYKVVYGVRSCLISFHYLAAKFGMCPPAMVNFMCQVGWAVVPDVS